MVKTSITQQMESSKTDWGKRAHKTKFLKKELNTWCFGFLDTTAIASG